MVDPCLTTFLGSKEASVRASQNHVARTKRSKSMCLSIESGTDILGGLPFLCQIQRASDDRYSHLASGEPWLPI